MNMVCGRLMTYEGETDTISTNLKKIRHLILPSIPVYYTANLKP
jgi:hypothetical protein